MEEIVALRQDSVNEERGARRASVLIGQVAALDQDLGGLAKYLGAQVEPRNQPLADAPQAIRIGSERTASSLLCRHGVRFLVLIGFAHDSLSARREMGCPPGNLPATRTTRWQWQLQAHSGYRHKRRRVEGFRRRSRRVVAELRHPCYHSGTICDTIGVRSGGG